MANEQKYPFIKAHKAAEYIASLLRPHCHRLHIAGSIRRIRPEVKDIEIVCQPKMQRLSDLFGWDEGTYPDKDFIKALGSITHETISGDVSGRMMKIKTNSRLCPGIQLDLFMPQPEDYFRIYAIRTGSAEYARHVIAAGWNKKGWAGVRGLGLRKISECNVKTDAAGKKTYTIKEDVIMPSVPPAWESEGEFFSWLGLGYIDPQEREFYKTVNEAL